MENHGIIDYNEDLEKLLCREAEKCLCLRWVHNKAQKYNATWNTRLAIPTIILSTLAGSAGLAGEQLLPFSGATTLIGLITLLCSILNTISAYYGFAKKAEAHRIASLSYGRLHQLLEMELSMPRKQRMSAGQLLEELRDETERLNEIVPILDDPVIDMFRRRFHEENITKPPELNGLERVQVSQSENITIKIEDGKALSAGRIGQQRSAV